MALLPSRSGVTFAGVWLATITRVDAFGPWVRIPRTQPGLEYGPCQAPMLSFDDAPYTAGDRVLVAPLEGRPDEYAIVARTATAPGPPVAQ